MHLQDLQRLFQQRVLEGSSGIESQLVACETEYFPARLATYTDGYRSRLVEALSTTYPGLRALLGEDAFEQAVRRFIEVVPSRHYSIRYYGESLSEHIGAEHAEAEAKVLQDLARWEWALAEVFDAHDDVPVAPERLGGMAPDDWPCMVLSFRASVRSLTMASNAVQWWRWARDSGDRPPAFELGPAASWRLWRQGIRTLFRSMDSSESAALAVVRGGGTFGEMCEAIAEEVGAAAAPARAASILSGWFSDEMIGDVTVRADLPKKQQQNG